MIMHHTIATYGVRQINHEEWCYEVRNVFRRTFEFSTFFWTDDINAAHDYQHYLNEVHHQCSVNYYRVQEYISWL